MQGDEIQRLIDDAARKERTAFVFDGDEVEVAVALAGSCVLLEPGRSIELSQVKFAGLI